MVPGWDRVDVECPGRVPSTPGHACTSARRLHVHEVEAAVGPEMGEARSGLAQRAVAAAAVEGPAAEQRALLVGERSGRA